MYRQGDVLVTRIDKLPRGLQKAPTCVLALGEVTGHMHQIKEGAFMYVDEKGDKYVEVFDETADLVHEEHGTITLDRGVYKVTQQREYTPEEIRRVAD